MPNVLNAAGLTVNTREELVDFFTTKMQEIYGADINLASDTPDGQMMNIYVQTVLDLQDLLVQVYNSFDPDTAIGTILDQRVAINGVQRQAGTYTVTPITITVTESVNLYGLDSTGEEIYTVADNAGNQWQLQETELGLTAGSHILNFQAAVPGEQLTIPNTITVPVTIVLGVSAINNPSPYSSLGINEETDAVLKVRRQQSVSLASQGYLAGLRAALLNVTGVTSVFIYENTTGSTDSDGVPGHSIWVIVGGSAADADIAQAIYTKRNAGCGMYGEESYIITQIDGSPFEVLWDEVDSEPIFIFLNVESIDGVLPPNIETIREELPSLVTPNVFQTLNINQISTAVQEIDPNCLVEPTSYMTSALEQIIELSDPATDGTFKFSYNGNETAALNWNDSAGTLQTALQGLTGLASATLTGTPVSGTMTIDLSNVSGVQDLIYITDSTLEDFATDLITFDYQYDEETVLSPSNKQNQFVITSENIIITPTQLLPLMVTVEATQSQDFNTYGGYGPYTYIFLTNNSGGNIDAETGTYTAGALTGTDTIQSTDALGNTAVATVTVI